MRRGVKRDAVRPDEGALEGDDAGDDVDVDVDVDVLELSLISGTNGSLGASRRIARVRFAETATVASLVSDAVAGVASVVTDAGAVLEDELEPFISFGSSNASTATRTTARPT